MSRYYETGETIEGLAEVRSLTGHRTGEEANDQLEWNLVVKYSQSVFNLLKSYITFSLRCLSLRDPPSVSTCKDVNDRGTGSPGMDKRSPPTRLYTCDLTSIPTLVVLCGLKLNKLG